MIRKLTLIVALALCGALTATKAENKVIGKQNPTIEGRRLSPEVLWAMGRIGGYAPSPDGGMVAYNVAYYSVEENKAHHVIYVMNSDGTGQKLLTTTADNETDVQWIDGGVRLAFLLDGQVWTQKPDGSERRKLTNDETEIEGFQFSPDGQKLLLIKSLPYYGSIKQRPADLPKSTGRLVTDMNYRHWDHYVESIAHPFVATRQSDGTFDAGRDLLEGEPYECPTAPFGGVEQLAWSPDSKYVAYTCRKKEGVQYAISTDTDIYLYNVETNEVRNLCKSGKPLPTSDATKTMAFQAINSEEYADENVGYDTNPQFSPDGKKIAWLSMKRDGYESDRNRLCIYDLQTGSKNYVSEQFDSNVDDFCWADNKTLYFIGVWHATENLYRTNLKGEVVRLTEMTADFGSLKMLGKKKLIAERHDYFSPADLYVITPGKDVKSTTATQVTFENKHILDRLDRGSVESRWVKTSDGKDMLYWVVLPPNFDPARKYPTLLFCEGGPQSPVSQFWSYRWNFYIMAAQGYVVIAPNRRGLPGFGSQWCEQISGDWTGQCMTDYLTAIDDAAASLPYVDRDHLGCVGASFGGFSVYYLAGHHERRFKCFISHDGTFNLESMYTDTEEVWFSNWEYDDAYWNKDQTARARRTYDNSPHLSVDKWDTPILCIHGEKDYRINANQGMGAFNAARLRGIPAELLIFPDENHWVLKPQNGILWQRTYFDWLDRWLK